MNLTKKWQKGLAAAVLGTFIAGAPLFAAHAEEGAAFSRDGERYDVRRGAYEKADGSDEHVRLGQYADEKHRDARHEQRREDLEKRQSKEREDFEKRQGEERKKFEERKDEERKNFEEHQDDRHAKDRDEHRDDHRDDKDHRDHRHEERNDSHGHDGHRSEQREYRYDVRRGMYEKEGGSDTEVSRGKYEQPAKDGEHHGLSR